MPNADNLCMGCMNPLPAGRAECGICGYPVAGENPPPYLPVRTLLSERYVVGRALEGGGDAALYLGYDTVLKGPILIREFLPDTLCGRDSGCEIRVIAGCENTYLDYLERFRNHARALARMRDLPCVVPVYDIFEQNNTAYTVSEYCEGISLERRLVQTGGRMRWDEARPLFMPLMATLVSLHAAGLNHLGIAPQNLVIGTDGRLRLRGFAIPEARTVSTDLKPRLLPGYSAPEQYGFELSPGAASDVYGLAATVFRTLTGNPPPEGSSRAKNSTDLFMPAEVAKELPDYVAAALFNALQVAPDKRTQSVAAFRDQLSTAPAVSALIQDQKEQAPAPEPVSPPEPPEPKKKKGRARYAVLIVVAVFIVLLLIGAVVLMMLFPDWFSGGKPESSSAAPPPPTLSLDQSTAPTQSGEYIKQYIVPNLVGKDYYDIKDSTAVGNVKIEVVFEYLQYSSQPEGTILSQTPNKGDSVNEGTPIKVVISAGPEENAIPNVVGWPQEYAEALLKEKGFKVDVVKVLVSEYDRGLVDSIEPAVGEKLGRGDTVTLKVSDKEPVTEPPADPTDPNIPADNPDVW